MGEPKRSYIEEKAERIRRVREEFKLLMPQGLELLVNGTPVSATPVDRPRAVVLPEGRWMPRLIWPEYERLPAGLPEYTTREGLDELWNGIGFSAELIGKRNGIHPNAYTCSQMLSGWNESRIRNQHLTIVSYQLYIVDSGRIKKRKGRRTH